MPDHQTGLEMGSQDSVVTEPLSISPLSPAHAEGIRALSREPDFAGAAGMAVALSEEGAADYIATATKAQDDGRSYVFVLTRGTEVLGVCRLIGVLGVPRLIVSIGAAYRGQGNGSFIVRHVLEFAFETLQLHRVTASGACLVIVAQCGHVNGNTLTRQEWLAKRARTAR
jgi:RimJ/RimL family protein N-acetyltransferase